MKDVTIRRSLVCIAAALSLISFAQAQQVLWGPTLSYQYQRGNVAKTGGYIAMNLNSDNILKVDATANFTWTQSKSTVIPEVALSFYPESWVVAPFARAEVTPYNWTPKVGISAATLMELDFGYAFSTNNKSGYRPMKGFSGSLRFNIPLNFKLNM